MKTFVRSKLAAMLASCALAIGSQSVRASIAYGSINNFDTVNDTGQVCHGFEIEVEDCLSTDITYTFDYNHYGTPRIEQDDSVPGHPKCRIRWESKKNPDGTWASFTAIPAGPIPPTNGHMFTDPSVNFGGEHFGTGFNRAVGAIRYHWLVADASGALVHGGAVQVSTPTFTYYPPVVNPPQVQAVIAPPPPPAPEPKEFGKAVWVKEIRTTTHNNREVRLRDLLSDDPDDANDKNWTNGEPDEVESEWSILQKDYHKADAPNNQLVAAAEELPNGDEVVTRRYEFYKYTGPLDDETGEAMAQSVAADGIHGVGVKLINGVEVDLSAVEVVGAFTGSQMSAVDVDAPVGLIDHIGEASVGTEFAPRRVVIEGPLGFTCAREGGLPAGMAFDETTGVLSGTPSESGEFAFSITADDGTNPAVSKNYMLRVAAAGVALPPGSLVDTVAFPVEGGTTTGDGAYAPGDSVTVTAIAAAGYHFVSWTDNGKEVSNSPGYTFSIDINHSLVANFSNLPQWTIGTVSSPTDGGTCSGGGLADDGSTVTVVASPNAGFSFVNWTEGGVEVSALASYSFPATADRALVANFVVTPTYSIQTVAAPLAGGTAGGGGNFPVGTSVTVVADESPGYVFAGWTSGTDKVSSSPSHTFTVTGNKILTATFVLAGQPGSVTATANPSAGGEVHGGGGYLTGVIARVVAVPAPGYAFSKWQQGGVTVSTSVGYSFTVTGNHDLVARFNEAFVIDTSSSPSMGGTTEMDSLTYKTGESAKAKAFPADGWTFAGWTENGVVVSADSIYDFVVSGNRKLVARFTWDGGVTVTTRASSAIGGTVSGEGPYAVGDPVSVSAVQALGYRFMNWSENGVVVSEDADYLFTAETNRDLVAHFAPEMNIGVSAMPPDGGVTAGGGPFVAGETASLTAIANPGWAFTGWSEGGAATDFPASYSFTVAGPRTLVANFICLPELVATHGAPGAGQIILSWPATAQGWVLQECSGLTGWTPSPLTVTVVDGMNTVTVNTEPGRRFFRLAHP